MYDFDCEFVLMLLCVAFRFIQKVFDEGEVGDCEVTQSKDSWQQSV